MCLDGQDQFKDYCFAYIMMYCLYFEKTTDKQEFFQGDFALSCEMGNRVMPLGVKPSNIWCEAL